MSLPTEEYTNQNAETHENQMGFAQIPNEIYTMGLGMNAIAVFCYLTRRMNWKTGECYPSQVHMAETFRCGRNRVREALTELKEAGLITTKKRKKQNGRNSSLMYYITFRVGAIRPDLPEQNEQGPEEPPCSKTEQGGVPKQNSLNDTHPDDSSYKLSLNQDCKSVEETKPSKEEREIKKEPEQPEAKGETCMDCDAKPNKGYPRCLSCHLKHQGKPNTQGASEDKSIVRETPKVILEQRERDAKEKKLTKSAKQKRHEANMEAMRQGFAKAKGDAQAQIPNAKAPMKKDKIGGRTYKLREGFEFWCPQGCSGTAKITRTDDDLYLDCSDDACGVTKLDDAGLKKISSEKATYTVDLTKKILKSPQTKTFVEPAASPILA